MSYKIPNIIHYTFKNRNLPSDIIANIEHNKRICPGFNFIFYDDNDIDKFIKDNFDEQVYNAFKGINDKFGAMKADFFRYCVLYILGGVYIDIKSRINMPLKSIIRPADICLLDIPRSNLESWRKTAPTHEQWLLIFAPKHPYLLSMINLMVHYINTRYEPHIRGLNRLTSKQKVLNVTGPDAFTRAIKMYLIKNGIHNIHLVKHRLIDYNRYFSLIGVPNYRNMYTINGAKHYSENGNESIYK